MSRKLNIERRRKRIRHYNARRRQRSHARRAFSYWWSPVLLLFFVFLTTAHTIAWFFPHALKPQPSFELPQARESIHYVSHEELHAFLSRGILQQASRLISDQEIGISLDLPLPTAPVYEPKPLGEFPILPHLKPTLAEMHLLPQAYTETIATPSPSLYTHAFSPELLAANYTFLLPKLPVGEAGDATFFIQTNHEGKVESALKLSPVGKETPFLRQLRLALLQGTAQGEVCGTLRIQWRNKESSQ